MSPGWVKRGDDRHVYGLTAEKRSRHDVTGDHRTCRPLDHAPSALGRSNSDRYEDCPPRRSTATGPGLPWGARVAWPRGVHLRLAALVGAGVMSVLAQRAASRQPLTRAIGRSAGPGRPRRNGEPPARQRATDIGSRVYRQPLAESDALEALEHRQDGGPHSASQQTGCIHVSLNDSGRSRLLSSGGRRRTRDGHGDSRGDGDPRVRTHAHLPVRAHLAVDVWAVRARVAG